MSEVGKLWLHIQDMIGDASLWPKQIRESFWTQKLRHIERRNICCFVFVNGRNPEIFLMGPSHEVEWRHRGSGGIQNTTRCF